MIDAVEKKQKKRINYLSGSYITTLINIGYQKNYIHFRLRKLFFDKRRPINSLETLNDFFDEFDLELKDYKVIFKGSKLLNEIKDSCQSFDITITDDFAFEGPNGKGFANQKTEDEVFVICDEISALDGIAAKVNAERKIGRIVNLFTYFHHKEVPHWSNDAIVIRNGLEHPVKKHTSPMVKIPDMRPGKAAKDLNEVLKNFNLESRSLKKFNRAFDLHGLAVSGEEVENQILNTWIAFETMIDGKDGGSKIQQISDAIVPFINLFYLRNIINYTYQSLRRWNIAFIRELLSKVPDSKNGLPQDKVAMIIACEEFKDLRTELLAELESFILLRFRVWQLSEVLKNGKSIRVFIEQHTTKVIWHIRRIYRARNLIVHEGTIDPNIDILAENAHSYLDSFMNGIIYLSAYDRHIITINQGIKESNILYHFWQKTLKNNEKTKCSVDNYALFLFGE